MYTKLLWYKNKTLYDEIKLLFQANFHLHHNCAKNTRKLGWHLIYWSFGLPPCTANTQSLGFFFTMSTIDERRCSFAISFVNFTTAITKMNKSDNKVTTTIILVIYIFFFKPRNSNMKHISCKQWFFLVCR